MQFGPAAGYSSTRAEIGAATGSLRVSGSGQQLQQEAQKLALVTSIHWVAETLKQHDYRPDYFAGLILNMTPEEEPKTLQMMHMLRKYCKHLMLLMLDVRDPCKGNNSGRLWSSSREEHRFSPRLDLPPLAELHRKLKPVIPLIKPLLYLGMREASGLLVPWRDLKLSSKSTN
ncbi:hypothetical protein HAX54_047554 [Datura stramonium]|uniref:Uncharacterized protein n=1 Tax=Datura stramonium TaxID=4076 RepID=A0ABS8RQP5_DATST|nr:hypothetical protein [Datura stramonium]